jgi:hypothetical protein
MEYVQGPSEPGGPTAPEPASGQPPSPAPAGTSSSGGAGLYDHAAADPFPRSAGLVSGIVALGLTLVVAAAFFFLNPAFSAGRAGGAPDQLGPRPVASPSVSVGPSVAASPSVSASPGVSASPAVSGSPSVSPSPGVSASPGPSPSPSR